MIETWLREATVRELWLLIVFVLALGATLGIALAFAMIGAFEWQRERRAVREGQRLAVAAFEPAPVLKSALPGATPGAAARREPPRPPPRAPTKGAT